MARRSPLKGREAEIAARRAAGESVGALAAEFGVTRAAIYQAILRAGAPTRNASAGWTVEDDDALRRYLEQGMPVRSIAAMLGRAAGAARTHMRDLGLQSRARAFRALG